SPLALFSVRQGKEWVAAVSVCFGRALTDTAGNNRTPIEESTGRALRRCPSSRQMPRTPPVAIRTMTFPQRQGLVPEPCVRHSSFLHRESRRLSTLRGDPRGRNTKPL